MLHHRWLVIGMVMWVTSCGGSLVVPTECGEQGCACTVAGDCAAGLTCTGGVCAPAAACSVAAPEGACPAGRRCAQGVCAIGDWCEGCTSTQGCQEGTCVEVQSNACGEGNPSGVCPMGQVCLHGACTELTAANYCSHERPSGLCPDGAACRDGACVPISEDPCSPTSPEGLCPSGQRCVAPGTCHRPACSPDQLFGLCSEGMYCSLTGACVADGTCAVDGDCGSRYICDDATCLRDFSCNGPSQCLSGERCASTGQCLPSGSCVTEAECDAGQRCSSTGQCLSALSCANDDDCAAPERCGSAHVCLASGACSTLNDCPPGHGCHSQTCVPAGTLCTELTGVPAACSPGETCCALGQRCSSAGSCVPVGACVTDDDCLVGYQVCNERYICEAITTCAGPGDCDPGERCTQTGACVPNAKCLIDLDCAEGEICSAVYECTTEANCGVTEFQTTLVKPNMLIVLDRSGSMNQCVGNAADQNTRWDQALVAINQVVTANSDRVRFGLSTYPAKCPGTSRDPSLCNNTGQNGCPQCNGSNQGTAQCPAPSSSNDNRTPGGVDVAIGESTGAAIDASLAANFPGGRTPTGPTIRGILADRGGFGLPSPSDAEERGNYILLITDGEPNEDPDCGNDAACVNGALDRLRSANPNVHTFVVGFAFSSVSNSLNCNAVYGGTSLCGSSVTPASCNGEQDARRECTCAGSSAVPCYYDAANAAALSAAFEEIVGEVASCSYSLDGAPPDSNRLYVFLDYGSGDRVSVPRGDGTWAYDHVTNQVSLFGATCQDVQSGAATPRVVYGCPQGGGG